jgi:hypothetical protein
MISCFGSPISKKADPEMYDSWMQKRTWNLQRRIGLSSSTLAPEMWKRPPKIGESRPGFDTSVCRVFALVREPDLGSTQKLLLAFATVVGSFVAIFLMVGDMVINRERHTN